MKATPCKLAVRCSKNENERIRKSRIVAHSDRIVNHFMQHDINFNFLLHAQWILNIKTIHSSINTLLPLISYIYN